MVSLLGDLSGRTLVQFDCQGWRSRVRSVAVHVESKLGDYSIGSIDIPYDQWNYIAANGDSELVFALVCAR